MRFSQVLSLSTDNFIEIYVILLKTLQRGGKNDRV